MFWQGALLSLSLCFALGIVNVAADYSGRSLDAVDRRHLGAPGFAVVSAVVFAGLAGDVFVNGNRSFVAP